MAKRGRVEDGAGASSVVTTLPLSAGSAAGALTLLEGEVVRHEEPNTQLVLGSAPVAGQGKLYITTSRLAWVPDAEGGQGFAVQYPDIVLHAICRDPEAYDKPCIFAQLATEEDAGDDDAAEAISELRLVPSDAAALDAIFEAMSACAELHPDAAMDDGEDDDDSAMMGGGLGMGGPGECAPRRRDRRRAPSPSTLSPRHCASAGSLEALSGMLTFAPGIEGAGDEEDEDGAGGGGGAPGQFDDAPA